MIKIGLLDVLKASYRTAVNPYRFFGEKDILGNINGYNIIHCNDFVWGKNVVLAMVTANDETFKSGNIFIDDFFLKAPDYVKEFIIHHEMGHVNNNDRMKLKRNLQVEINADKYALEKIGKEKTVKALQYLVNNSKVKRELKKRLEAINKI